MTAQDFAFKATDLIMMGKLDRYLDMISVAIRSRNEELHRRKEIEHLHTITVGDRVVLRNIRPKYLEGYEGVVTATTIRRAKQHFVVDLDVDRVRRFSGKGIICPPAAVEKV